MPGIGFSPSLIAASAARTGRDCCRLNAVRNWKFEPVTSHGQPVLVQTEQEFDFGGDR